MPSFFFFALCASGSFFCQKIGHEVQRFTFEHPQMGTVFRLVFYASPDSTQAAAIANEVFEMVDSLNAHMSDYLPESELNRLCATAGTGRYVPVSDDLWQILVISERYSQQTEGTFDISIGPLTRLWRSVRNLKEMPDSARVFAEHAKVGYRNIRLGKNKTVLLAKAGMRLDLGGIAQGFAADRCLKILRRHGIKKALADAGGDIALGDPPPGEKGWKIEVPTKNGTAVRILSNCGITTSGASYRYVELGGKRFSHIIDPRSGWPLDHHLLATVEAPSATEADVWATALSVLGKSGWAKLKQKPKHVRIALTEERL